MHAVTNEEIEVTDLVKVKVKVKVKIEVLG
jgi:hypothetical protein